MVEGGGGGREVRVRGGKERSEGRKEGREEGRREMSEGDHM